MIGKWTKHLDADLKLGVFKAAQRVASCPHVTTCGSEFYRRYGQAQPGERRHFAKQPSPDFVGSRYRGLLILGGNPGLAHRKIQHQNDAHVFGLQHRIANGEQAAFDELLAFMPVSMAHWPQVVNNDGRERLKYDLEEVAYVDIVKCGTAPGRGDALALFDGTGILDRCWRHHTRALLDMLNPTHILGLWTPITRVLTHLGYPLKDKKIGYYNGARHLTKDARYAPAHAVVDHFYGREL